MKVTDFEQAKCSEKAVSLSSCLRTSGRESKRFSHIFECRCTRKWETCTAPVRSDSLYGYGQNKDHPSDGSVFISHKISITTLYCVGYSITFIPMLTTIAVILLVLWILGFFTFHVVGWFIHVLLVVAVVMFLIRIIQGRNPLN